LQFKHVPFFDRVHIDGRDLLGGFSHGKLFCEGSAPIELLFATGVGAENGSIAHCGGRIGIHNGDR
jgi:hypothetical protein